MRSGFPSKLILIVVTALSLCATVRADSFHDSALNLAHTVYFGTKFLGNIGPVNLAGLPPVDISQNHGLLDEPPPVLFGGIPVDSFTFGFDPFLSIPDATVGWTLNLENGFGLEFGTFTVGTEDRATFTVPQIFAFPQSMQGNQVQAGEWITPAFLDVVIIDDGGETTTRFNFDFVQTITEPVPTPTPEPGTLLLFGTGIGGLGWLRRRNLSRRTIQDQIDGIARDKQ